MAKKKAVDDPPILVAGKNVELSRSYFRFNSKDAPFTRGEVYSIKKVVKHSRPGDGMYVRTAVVLIDDKEGERTIDNSFLVKPPLSSALKATSKSRRVLIE